MTAKAAKPSDSKADTELAREMEALGIARVPVDYFHVGEFRYTSLADALAEGRRRRSAGASM